MSCNCKADWRVEAIDLATGERVTYLDYFSFSFDDLLNQVGAGNVVLPVRKVTPGDVWPHLRAVAITRVSGPDASTAQPVCEYIGMVEAMDAKSDGAVTLGLQSIEQYLLYRIIDSTRNFPSFPLTLIAEDLVNLASSNGIPLTADSITGATVVSRTYDIASDMRILDAVLELTQTEGGPDYRREFTQTGNAWSTLLRFMDTLGSTGGVISDKRGAITYGLSVDATQHANWERGRGNEFVGAYTKDNTVGSIYPRFDKAQQWSEVSSGTILAANVRGDLANNVDPIAVPDVTITDLEISAPIKIGDTVTLHVDHGAVQYHGPARVVGKSWVSQPESPTSCTFSFVPGASASDTILVVDGPAFPARGCCA